jgi:hypothetical protein
VAGTAPPIPIPQAPAVAQVTEPATPTTGPAVGAVAAPASATGGAPDTQDEGEDRPAPSFEDLSPEDQQWLADYYERQGPDLYGDLDDAENYLKYIGGLYLAIAFGAMIVGISFGLDVLVAGCMVAGSYQAVKGEEESLAKRSAMQFSIALAFLFAGMVLAFVTIGVGLMVAPSLLVVVQILFLLVILYGIVKVNAVRAHVAARYKADPNAYRTDHTWLHELGK